MVRFLRAQPIPVLLIWASLWIALGFALVERQWSLAFVAAVTFCLTLAPTLLSERMHIRLPVTFTVGVVLFIYATIFLGEAFDFYNRYWWWDIVLHGGSAVGFGIVGFLFAFTLFEGDKYAAPAWALGFIGFAFAMTIGALWEIFEYAMDRNFGLDMQKSGLQDTMWDLIVDMVGGAMGGTAGFLYLKGQELGGLTSLIGEFVRQNGRFFRKLRPRRR